jgi:hypothetical protein
MNLDLLDTFFFLYKSNLFVFFKNIRSFGDSLSLFDLVYYQLELRKGEEKGSERILEIIMDFLGRLRVDFEG